MATRPSVPTEIKRQVLVEAGHRCAIPTCKNPDVDIHHIIPWQDCQKHEFTNLIALCPNCHRRAHSLKIDKKSLILYKNKLQSNADVLSTALYSKSDSAPGLEWEALEIDVQEKLETAFEVRLIYPHFLKQGINFKILNSLLSWEAHEVLMHARLEAAAKLTIEDKDAWWTDVPSVNSSSFSISVFTQTILSFKTSTYWYGAGAAHGHERTKGRNFILEPLEEISLETLLQKNDSALRAVALFCRRFLLAENASETVDEWVDSGTEADWANFDSFFFTLTGIVICFAPYAVGSYAEGEREVPISSRFLIPYIKEDSLFLKLWRES